MGQGVTGIRARDVATLVRHAWEPLAAIPTMAVLHAYGLVGVLPLWLTLLPLVLVSLVLQPGVQRRIERGPLGRWRYTTACLHIVLVTAIVYVVGWGPILPVAFALVSAHRIRMDGPAVWRPAVVTTVIGVLFCQAGIAAGWIFTYLPPVQAQSAGLFGMMLTVLFISAHGRAAAERDRAEAALADSEERFRILVQDSHDVNCVLDEQGNPIYLSPAIERVTGYPPEYYRTGGYAGHLHPDDLPGLGDALARLYADPDREQVYQFRLLHRDGGWRWMEATLRDFRDRPAVAGVVSAFRDVTERKRFEQRLAYEAEHDQLTGLVNRATFLRELERRATGGRPPAVLFVDLDGFKDINDTYGHRYGDAVLEAVADMLRRSISGADLAGRLGGDEFAVALTPPPHTGPSGHADLAASVADHLLAELASPVTVDGRMLQVRASIGIAVPDDAGTAAADLLHRADLAMYAAKRRGNHDAEFYDPAVVSWRDARR
jgi:diguanylate cyclase (GGDEF)-like protein/PAS domain S-box-containing protein